MCKYTQNVVVCDKKSDRKVKEKITENKRRKMKFFSIKLSSIQMWRERERARVNEGWNVVWVKIDRKFCNTSECCFSTPSMTLKKLEIIVEKNHHLRVLQLLTCESFFTRNSPFVDIMTFELFISPWHVFILVKHLFKMLSTFNLKGI